MINILTLPYPDEIIYSWVARYHKHSGNANMYITSEELFGVREKIENLIVPSRLEFLSDELPSEWKFTVREIIDNHTIFPIYKIFMSDENITKVLRGMLYKKYIGIEDMFLCDMKKFYNHDEIKVCQKCYEEDIQMYGEAYLHRAHQIPGIRTCDRHLVYLTCYKIPFVNQTSYYILNINDVQIDFERTLCKNVREIDITKEITSLFACTLSDFNIKSLNRIYENGLKVKGYKSNGGKINQNKLLSDFNKFYCDETLKIFNSQIDTKDKNNWLTRLTQMNKIYIHPIRHVLFMNFLFGSLEECLNYGEQYSLYPNKQFFCLNPIADHYNQKIVEVVQTKYDYNDGELQIVLKCDCGFKYSIKPNKCKDEPASTKIKEYGALWEAKLAELITKAEFTIKQIAKQMHCSPTTVVKYATKLGLLNKINSKQKIIIKEDTIMYKETLLKEYKDLIEAYLAENQGSSRSAIKERYSYQYRFIYEHDRSWIEDRIPSLRQEAGKKSGSYNKSWDLIDAELCDELEKAIKYLLKHENIIWITKTSLSKVIGNSLINSNAFLEKVPKTRMMLIDKTESRADFNRRKRLMSST